MKINQPKPTQKPVDNREAPVTGAPHRSARRLARTIRELVDLPAFGYPA